MREYTFKHGGKTYRMAANFKAAMRMAQEVADPIQISMEMLKEQMFMERGLTYRPLWKPTVEGITKIIEIGLAAADPEIVEETVQDLVFEMGFNAAAETALQYLALIASPASAPVQKKGKAAATGKI